MTPTETPQPDPPSLQGRAVTTAPPHLCGFYDGTSSVACSVGSTCKFNTDAYVVACCSDDKCNWWSTCCDYNPWSATNFVGTYTPDCGGNAQFASCLSSEAPWCGTYRWENGFVSFWCTANPSSRFGTVLFTSAGETTVREGLIRLTGRDGPATPAAQGPTTVTATMMVTAEVPAKGGGPNAGAIAGGAVGGVAFGAILTFLGLLLAGYFRKRQLAGRQAAGSPYGPTSPYGLTPELGQRQ
ncbi:hypothetical protein QBC39DRAFT_331205 [Podospora conica]|nr:hypothetical protein QBC39DRAFT_331205 [Schizothecium conicum]